MVHFQSLLGISEILCPPSNSPNPLLPPGNTCFLHKVAFPREFIGVESYPAFCFGSCFFQLVFSRLFTLGEMTILIKVSSSRPDYLRSTQGTFCPPPVYHDTCAACMCTHAHIHTHTFYSLILACCGFNKFSHSEQKSLLLQVILQTTQNKSSAKYCMAMWSFS